MRRVSASTDVSRLTRVRAVTSCRKTAKHRLDVDYRGVVDRFDWSNQEAVAGDLLHGHGMEAERVRPILRSCRENTAQRSGPVVARVDLQHIALRFVEPRDDDDLVTDADAIERVNQRLIDVEPCVDAAFLTLFWRGGLRLD